MNIFDLSNSIDVGLFMELSYKQEQHVKRYLAIYATHLAGSLLLKMLKHFAVILNILNFSA